MRLFRDALWTLAFAALVVVLAFLMWSLYGTAHSHVENNNFLHVNQTGE